MSTLYFVPNFKKTMARLLRFIGDSLLVVRSLPPAPPSGRLDEVTAMATVRDVLRQIHAEEMACAGECASSRWSELQADSIPPAG
jgi:hypothetical protein